MQRPTQAGDIAREAIKRLASRRQPPTPENFKRAYAEVEGKELVSADWPEAIRTLLKRWDDYHAGLTQSRKRDMLERVLINFGNNPEELAGKLVNLARSWGASKGDEGLVDEGALETPPADGRTIPDKETPPAAAMQQTAPSEAAVVPVDRLAGLLAENLGVLAGAMTNRWPDLAEQARSLAKNFSQGGAADEQDIAKLSALWREILVRADDDYELLGGMQRLLSSLFRNMGDLVGEDGWMQGQITSVENLISGELNYHVLHEAERSLQELVARQGQLRDSLTEAKQKLKMLISTFINRVGDISNSTGEYHEKLQGYSEKITQAEDISELGDLIDGLTSDMGAMREAMHRTHLELQEARSHVEEADKRIGELEKELEEVSAKVREDQLTGALNRRGMEEAFNREMARSERLGAPLSLALLDIDHFKRLNDSLGHQAGDQALVHLASVTRSLLRPTDSLARYGGEEFLILLPNTDLWEAEAIMQRVQRELTKQYFLHENQKVLITFSAGVAQIEANETSQALIARADKAMYRAKTAGRNRVERA